MKALIQRVKRSRVTVDGRVLSEIGNGMLVFLSVKQGDSEEDAKYLADRCVLLRIFEDENGRMNRSVQDVAGSALVVSQFTLHGDTRRGNRPSFDKAAPPEVAEHLYEVFLEHLKTQLGEHRVAAGAFRAMMDVELVNDGPVTIMIQSKSEYTSS